MRRWSVDRRLTVAGALLIAAGVAGQLLEWLL